MIEAERKELGVIDVLHNNVGLAKGGNPSLSTPEDWRRIQDANVTALHFTRTLAIEVAPFGIRANTIVAGLIDTPRIKIYLKNSYDGYSIDEMRAKRNRVVPLGRMGVSWDVAEAAVFLASDRASYITGTELVVDVVLSMTMPH